MLSIIEESVSQSVKTWEKRSALSALTNAISDIWYENCEGSSFGSMMSVPGR